MAIPMTFIFTKTPVTVCLCKENLLIVQHFYLYKWQMVNENRISGKLIKLHENFIW